MDNKKQSKSKNGSATTEQVDSAQPQIKEFNGGVTAEQIGIWKNQHGRIAEVRITDDEVAECHVGYFRRPDMKTMQAVNATSKTDEVKASEVMFNNCWLGGSQMLQTDAILKMEAMATLGTMFGKCTRHLKKLVEAYRISDKIDEQEIAKGCALIRANFHVAPESLSMDEWAMMFQQACWLENERLSNLAKILSKLLAPANE